MNKDTLLQEMVTSIWPHVAAHGWSWGAIKSFAADHDQDYGLIKLAFPGGLDELLIAVNKALDKKIEGQIEKGLGVTSTLKAALEYKIDFKLAHRQAFQKIFQYLWAPPRPLLALKLAFKTVNQFWYRAGDQSTDYNYYSKRILLMYVYIPTMVYLLRSHKSKDQIVAFMNHRFTEVAIIPKLKNRFKFFRR